MKVQDPTGLAIQLHITPPPPPCMWHSAHNLYWRCPADTQDHNGAKPDQVTLVSHMVIYSLLLGPVPGDGWTYHRKCTIRKAMMSLFGCGIRIPPESWQPLRNPDQKSGQHLQNPGVMAVSTEIPVRNARSAWWCWTLCGYLCWTGLECPFHKEIAPAQRIIL